MSGWVGATGRFERIGRGVRKKILPEFEQRVLVNADVWVQEYKLTTIQSQFH